MKKGLMLLMACVLAFSLAACGNPATSSNQGNDKTDATGTGQTPSSDPADKDMESMPAQRKVVNLWENSNIPSLVTWLATDEVSFRNIGNINSGLFTNDLNGLPVEDLVDTYEVSEDGLVYTFHLKDQMWVTVDGEDYAPVTAEDFVFAVKKLLDPKEASQYAFMAATAAIKNGPAAVALSESLVAYEGAKDKLSKIALGDFQDNEKETAQQQYDAQKASLEEEVKAAEADLNSKYGSVDKAYDEVYSLIENIGVKALDAKTLQYELEIPVPYFTALMSFVSFYPANQKFVEEKGEKYGSTVEDFLYNGAFIFKEWKISQRHYWEKNPKYWDAANTKLDGVDFRVIEGADNDTVVNMYLDGQLHGSPLAGENVEKYGTRPDVVLAEDSAVFYVQINQANGEPSSNKTLLSNAKARKALNMSLDKEYITDTILANGSLPADYLVPTNLQSSKDYDGKDFRDVADQLQAGAKRGYNPLNVEEAKKLWAEAKAETGINSAQFELLIYQSDTASSIGTHLKNEWEKNLEGLTVVIKPLPFSEKLARGNRGDFELDFAGWGPDYPDAMTFLDLFVTDGGHNKVGYSNPDYDAVINSAKSGDLTLPEKAKERFEALVNLEKTLLEEDQVIVPLYQRSLLSLRDPKLKDLKVQAFGANYIFKWADLVE